jgi:hypothetical protein
VSVMNFVLRVQYCVTTGTSKVESGTKSIRTHSMSNAIQEARHPNSLQFGLHYPGCYGGHMTFSDNRSKVNEMLVG